MYSMSISVYDPSMLIPLFESMQFMQINNKYVTSITWHTRTYHFNTSLIMYERYRYRPYFIQAEIVHGSTIPILTYRVVEMIWVLKSRNTDQHYRAQYTTSTLTLRYHYKRRFDCKFLHRIVNRQIIIIDVILYYYYSIQYSCHVHGLCMEIVRLKPAK